LGNGFARLDISRTAQEDRLERVGLLQIADEGGKGCWIPAFGGSIGGTWEDREVGLEGGIFWFGESGRWGKFCFPYGKAKIFQ
jgi:hypothetical protein